MTKQIEKQSGKSGINILSNFTPINFIHKGVIMFRESNSFSFQLRINPLTMLTKINFI